MCTVSWFYTAEGYELFCNRDELRTRPRAWAPRVRTRHGVRFSAPIDGASGGTWLGVNAFGLTLALLNRQGQTRADAALSRGWLVLDLLDSATPEEVRARLAKLPLHAFPPWTLAVLSPTQPARVMQWDGQNCWADPAAAGQPLTSSSYAANEVIAARQLQFQTMQTATATEPRALREQFHRSHAPAPSAYSVCMHRANAQTVSYSHIRVTGDHADFLYYPQAPCAAAGALPYATRLELEHA